MGAHDGREAAEEANNLTGYCHVGLWHLPNLDSPMRCGAAQLGAAWLANITEIASRLP